MGGAAYLRRCEGNNEPLDTLSIVRTYYPVVAISYECMAIHCIVIEIYCSRWVTATH